VNVIGLVPVHVPLETLRTEPTCGTPLIAGAAVTAGGVGGTLATVAVGDDHTRWDVPPEFVASTPTSMVEPTSADVGEYVDAATGWPEPSTSAVQFAPVVSQRFHR